jgi:hypothetical protein
MANIDRLRAARRASIILIIAGACACAEKGSVEKANEKAASPRGAAAEKSARAATSTIARTSTAVPAGLVQLKIFAVDPAGKEREIRNGAKVKLDERIRFTYDNPGPKPRTLVLFGFDGSAVHWYYPKTRDGAPLAIPGGDRNKAVPVEVALAGTHNVGSLVIGAGLDVDPQEFQEALTNGRSKQRFGNNVSVIHLELTK